MITKCDHLGCEKAGLCKCPKDRTLSAYWNFCQKHAGEYNKNWNYFAGMNEEEINKVWEKDIFGDSDKKESAAYAKSIDNFLKTRKMPEKKITLPKNIINALSTFELKASANWSDIQKKYRALAKQYHPDLSGSKDQKAFIKIGSDYQILKNYFNK